MYPIGARVRFVHLDVCGSIASPLKRSGVTGQPRQAVRWDNGRIATWNPALLRPAHTHVQHDPPQIVCEGLIFSIRFPGRAIPTYYT